MREYQCARETYAAVVLEALNVVEVQHTHQDNSVGIHHDSTSTENRD